MRITTTIVSPSPITMRHTLRLFHTLPPLLLIIGAFVLLPDVALAQEDEWGSGLECDNPRTMHVNVTLADEDVVNKADTQNEVYRWLHEKKFTVFAAKEEGEAPYLDVSVLTIPTAGRDFVFTIQTTYNRVTYYMVGAGEDAEVLRTWSSTYVDTITELGTYKDFQKSLHDVLDAFLKEYIPNNE